MRRVPYLPSGINRGKNLAPIASQSARTARRKLPSDRSKRRRTVFNQQSPLMLMSGRTSEPSTALHQPQDARRGSAVLPLPKDECSPEHASFGAKLQIQLMGRLSYEGGRRPRLSPNRYQNRSELSYSLMRPAPPVTREPVSHCLAGCRPSPEDTTRPTLPACSISSTRSTFTWHRTSLRPLQTFPL